jgi:thiamine biosynthesis lipoprotein
MGASESAMKVVRLENAALATSGDYRNYVADEKGLRHHILDPRTGRPASHTLASVSVITDDCMTADALATAFFVTGTEEGLKLAEQLPEVEALFIDRIEGEFELSSTEGFKQAIILMP